jgi:dipeptidyl aminopeptidase/acylaminoacyl peptidase
MFVGARISARTPTTAPEYKRYTVASPLTYVTRDDSPFLLFHGDEDTTVPFEQSTLMEATLQKAGVEVKFVPVPGGKHGRHFGLPAGDPRLSDYVGEAARWFDRHLRRQPTN